MRAATGVGNDATVSGANSSRVWRIQNRLQDQSKDCSLTVLRDAQRRRKEQGNANDQASAAASTMGTVRAHCARNPASGRGDIVGLRAATAGLALLDKRGRISPLEEMTTSYRFPWLPC
jgi:hypothetical protein